MVQKLLCLLLASVLLTSCSGLSFNTQDLLQAPKLNQRQVDVYEALERTLNTRNIIYKSPQTGEYRSSFVFFDLDGDTVQEAIVFYAYVEEPSQVRVKILRQSDGVWGSAHDFAGAGDTVDFLQFANLSSRTVVNMVIGWKSGRQGHQSLSIYSVYSMESTGMREEVNRPYLLYKIGSFLPGSLDQVVTLGKETGPGPYSLTLLRSLGGYIGEAGIADLSGEATDILQFSTSRLPDGSTGLYVDESFTGTVSATEIFRVAENALEPVATDNDEQWDLFAQTFRDQELICKDYDNNGIMEVPQPYDASELYPEGEYVPSLIRYLRLTEDEFFPAYTMALNEDAGYGLFLPKDWVTGLSIQRQTENKECRFYLVDEESAAPRKELLRIRVYSSKDVQDKFTQDYFLLATKGSFSYYGYIPPHEASDPVIKTRDEIQLLFLLL